MNLTKILIYSTLSIFAISGLNGFLIEEGLLNINRSILNLVLDISLLLIAIFSIRNTKQIRQLVIFFLVFLILTLISYTLNYNDLSVTTYFNGMREFLPYFLFPIIFFNIFQSYLRNSFVKKFNTFLYIFLILQIPISLYQYSQNGAGDMVGGTQGAGYSGIVTFIVFLATYYLISQKLDARNVLYSFFKNSYLLIFWLPAFINETKISFILIILFIFMLVKASINNIRQYIIITIILIPILFIFNSIYRNVVTNFDSTEFLDLEFLQNYLGSDDESYDDIPRLQRIAIFLKEFDLEEVLLGKGIGQFKGGSTIELTPFATKYEWLLQGSRSMFFFLLVQVGIIGAFLFIFYWIFIISLRQKKLRVNYSGNLIIFSTACFIIIQFYNDSFRSLFFCGIIMYIMFYAMSQKKDKGTFSINSLIYNPRKNDSTTTNFRNINL